MTSLYLLAERLCERYLHRRGRVVLPRAFVGAAFGFCHVVKREPSVLTVTLPFAECEIIALNHSYVDVS